MTGDLSGFRFRVGAVVSAVAQVAPPFDSKQERVSARERPATPLASRDWTKPWPTAARVALSAT